MGSVTTLAVAGYLSSPSKVENRILLEDRIEVNKLSAQINILADKYYKANESVEKQKLDAELRALAQEEAAIMRKYNPNYVPRWPPTVLLGKSWDFSWKSFVGFIIFAGVNFALFFSVRALMFARIEKKFVTPEMIRRIIDECEEGRELTDDERRLLVSFISRFEEIPGSEQADPLIFRARLCLGTVKREAR